MSSSCSSADLGIDADFDDILMESLLNDIEIFVEHVRRLRKALDTKVVASAEFDCETKCVQVHAALSMVSQSIRDLLVKYPNFKTSNVLIPASHLVYSVKAINFDSAHFDAGRSLQAIERLEAAIGTALRHSVNTKLFAGEISRTNTSHNHITPPGNKLNIAQSKDKSLGVIDKPSINCLATVENSTNVTSPLQNSLNACVNIAQSNDFFNGGQKLIKTTIELPELNGSSMMTSVTTGYASETLNSANVGKLRSSKSVGSSMASAVIQLSENDNIEPHNDIPSASSSLNSTNNSVAHAWSSKDSLSANGSVKSNGIEGRSASVGNRASQSSYISSSNKPLRNIISTSPLKTKQPHVKTNQPNGAFRLVRRHSAYQASANKISNDYADVDLNALQKQRNLVCNGSDLSTPPSSNAQLMREILTAHENGLELAFDRCKSWSKYATHLIMFVRSRLALEQEHMRNRQKLAEQTKSTLVADSCNNYLPLVGIFDDLMEVYGQFAHRMSQTVTSLNQRFITTLENRQKEHDSKRRKLKGDWTKQKKQFDACAEELRRAHLTLNSKEGGYLKARDLTMRHEQTVALPQQGGLLSLSYSSASASDTQMKKLKELDKKRKNEEDALTRKTDAENEVWRLEHELDVRRIELNDLRQVIINELCDLIRHCDLTTIACTSHYLKAFLELYAPVPEEYSRLAAYAMRESSPSSDYMSFLHSQLTSPGVNASGGSSACSASSTSFDRNDNSLNAPSQDLQNSVSAPSSAAISTSFSVNPFHHFNENRHQITQQHSIAAMSTESYHNPSPSTSSAVASHTNNSGCNSVATRRRNALNADEHYELIAETSQRRQKKSVARLFEQSSSTTSVDVSEAAKSHQLQRTRQVTKCAHCEHLVIFDALKCSTCGIVWHKKCLASVTVICGPSARRMTEECSAQRRMSIFGVPLKGHLDAQQRQIPLILERCVDELHRRGMSCKGLYRTCGVKSKIEQICVSFEQTAPEEKLDLSGVHPMNLASVIKLYLRRLPEPLMTYEMYNDWLQFNRETSTLEVIAQLRELVSRLPQQNYDTLKFLIIHLKRVTWFEVENLMTASNLAAVISPSLIWAKPVDMRQSTATAQHQQLTNKSNSISCSVPPDCASFINDAHQQTKAVEFLVQNAFEVFLIDRTTDWEEFFEMYPNVVKPIVVDDAETEADINKKANLNYCSKRDVCDEDDVDDEDDLDDEDEDENYDICGCSESSKTLPKVSGRETDGAKRNDDDDITVSGSNLTTTTTSMGYSSDERKSLYHRSPSAPAPADNPQMYAKHHVTADFVRNTNICRHHKNSTDDNQSLCGKSTASSSTSSSSFGLKRLKNSINASSGKSLPPTGSSASSNNATIENTPLENNAPLIAQDNDLSNLAPASAKPNVTTKTPKTRRTTGGAGVSSAKQRSFTTSILVSPQSDRKFAAILAARQKQLSKEETTGNNLTKDEECEIRKHSHDLRYFSNVLDTRKLRETARSYQRLAQENDFSDSENESAEAALKEEAKLARQENQKKRTLCSGEVVVDIKKEQYCLPNYISGRGARLGRNGIPLSSASFNTTSTPGIEVSKIALKRDSSVESNSPPKNSLPENIAECSQKGNDLPSLENNTGLLRRKRLERSAAYQSAASAAAASSSSSGTVVARYGNQPSSDWRNAKLTSNNQNATSFGINCNQVIHQSSPTIATTAAQNVNENENLIENSLDSRLQTAVGVIFSGSDVSYV